MSSPSCRAMRDLLGVYVVGAIDPAERNLVDVHLADCDDCREELAGLAVLPSLLRRVDFADAERMASAGREDARDAQPSPEVLTRLLADVSARRRSRRLRALAAVAAAVLIAAGAGATVSRLMASARPAPAPVYSVATASSAGLGATVRYGKASPGTVMWVRVSGFSPWTDCRFWVLTSGGKRWLAGGWVVGTGGDRLWYPVATGVPETSVTGFEITAGRTVLRIPAGSSGRRSASVAPVKHVYHS